MKTATLEKVTEDIRNNQGTKLNSIGTRINVPTSQVYSAVTVLIGQNIVTKKGKGRATQYFTSDFDRTTHTPFDNVPIVNRVANRTKVEYRPHPDSLLAQPDPTEIPENIFTVELSAKDVGIEEEEEEPKEEPKDEGHTYIAEPVTAIDYDRVIELVKIITPYEDIDGVKELIAKLEAKLSEAVKPCPFCGMKSRLEKSGTGEYRIECDCGFRFANIKYTKSAIDTIEAYNKRVTA